MYTKSQAILLGIALKAQAIGDSFGEEFEFYTDIDPLELSSTINSNKIVHITDDTQMTMFGIESMITGGRIENVVDHYIMWNKTQDQYPPIIYPDTDILFDQEKMWQIRAPGMTCTSSLTKLMNRQPVVNDSNGCGTVMKALPFLFSDSGQFLQDVSWLTHKGNHITDTAQFQWEIAQKLMRKESLNLYKGFPLETVYGDGGWQAKPCLDIAIWAFENCNGDFNKLLELSICHDGDSDSVAATAGVLYGLFYETYPEDLYNRIYEKDVIDKLIERVIKCAI